MMAWVSRGGCDVVADAGEPCHIAVRAAVEDADFGLVDLRRERPAAGRDDHQLVGRVAIGEGRIPQEDVAAFVGAHFDEVEAAAQRCAAIRVLRLCRHGEQRRAGKQKST